MKITTRKLVLEKRSHASAEVRTIVFVNYKCEAGRTRKRSYVLHHLSADLNLHRDYLGAVPAHNFPNLVDVVVIRQYATKFSTPDRRHAS
jgi:hypothetical protein